jgi:hypothetical protein
MVGCYILRTEAGAWPVVVVETLAEQVGGVAGWVVVVATTHESEHDAMIAARLVGCNCVMGWRKLARGERLASCRECQNPCIVRGSSP